MTGAYFRTLREACGLSLRDAAQLLAVAERTVAYWETGRSRIPPGVTATLCGLNAAIEHGADGAVAVYREVLEKHGPSAGVALTRYRSAADYQGSRAAGEGLPFPAHAALLVRTMLALERAGALVEIEWGPEPPAER